MRIHWGDVTFVCRSCRRGMRRLLIAKHLREGISHCSGGCGRQAMSASEARARARAVEAEEEESGAWMLGEYGPTPELYNTEGVK